MKFGFDIPGNVREAVSFDEANRNTIYQDAITLEMNNLCVALKLYKNGEKSSVGHTKITCHLIFDL